MKILHIRLLQQLPLMHDADSARQPGDFAKNMAGDKNRHSLIRRKLPEQSVGALVVATPGERQRLQLREPDMLGPVLETGVFVQ